MLKIHYNDNGSTIDSTDYPWAQATMTLDCCTIYGLPTEL